MPAAAAGPRRWLPWLLALLVVLLAAGAVIVGQIYWTGLHGSMDRLQASIAAARQQQRIMAERVREAETVLAERASQLGSDKAGAGLPGPDAKTLLALADELDALAAGLDGGRGAAEAAIDWTRLRADLRVLAREAGRLPPRHETGVSVGGRELRLLLEQAEQAAGLGDAVLTGGLLDAAERLLGRHYHGGRHWGEAGAALAARVARARARLGVSPAETATGLRRLAGQVRGLAEQ
jgi:hypothetical protein